MHIALTQLADVRDLQFADWGQTITFREVATTCDPATGDVEETFMDTQVLAVPGPEREAPEPNTAHHDLVRERTFLIRAEDVPAHASYATSRILWGSEEFVVLTADLAAGTGVVALSTRRVSGPSHGAAE
jgi:hypothetical protein